MNDKPVDLLPGMTVKHALISAELMGELALRRKVYDQWGNEIGLDGALSEGMRIYIR